MKLRCGIEKLRRSKCAGGVTSNDKHISSREVQHTMMEVLQNPVGKILILLAHLHLLSLALLNPERHCTNENTKYYVTKFDIRLHR